MENVVVPLKHLDNTKQDQQQLQDQDFLSSHSQIGLVETSPHFNTEQSISNLMSGIDRVSQLPGRPRQQSFAKNYEGQKQNISQIQIGNQGATPGFGILRKRTYNHDDDSGGHLLEMQGGPEEVESNKRLKLKEIGFSHGISNHGHHHHQTSNPSTQLMSQTVDSNLTGGPRRSVRERKGNFSQIVKIEGQPMRERNQFDNELDQVNYELALMKSNYPPQRRVVGTESGFHPTHSVLPDVDLEENDEEDEEEEDDDMGVAGVKKKKDKKLVFLSRSVLQKIRERPMTTGTQIANEILELYKQFSDKVDFKNVQRRVYDALNVLNAMDIIRKDRNHIFFNPNNPIIPDNNDLEAVDEEIEDPELKSLERERTRQRQLAEIEMLQKKVDEEEDRLRDRQELLLETIKQMIAIKKLMKRNQQRTLRQINTSAEAQKGVKSGNNTPTITPKSEKVTSAEEHSQASHSAVEKIHLPIIFVRVRNPHKAQFEVQLDDTQTKLRIFSSQKITTLTENHLFELLELTRASSDEEYNEFLEPALVQFIDRQPYLAKRGQEDVQGESLPGGDDDEQEGTTIAAEAQRINEQISKQELSNAKHFSPTIISNNDLQSSAGQEMLVGSITPDPATHAYKRSQTLRGKPQLGTSGSAGFQLVNPPLFNMAASMNESTNSYPHNQGGYNHGYGGNLLNFGIPSQIDSQNHNQGGFNASPPQNQMNFGRQSDVLSSQGGGFRVMNQQQHISNSYELMNNQGMYYPSGGRGRNNSSHGGMMRGVGSMFSRRDSGSNSSALNSNHNRGSSQGSRVQILNLTSPYREIYNNSASLIEQNFILGAPNGSLPPFNIDSSLGGGLVPQQDYEIPGDNLQNPFNYGPGGQYRTDRYPIGSPVINRSQAASHLARLSNIPTPEFNHNQSNNQYSLR